MNLTCMLHERAARHPDRPALVETRRGRDRVVTYRELSVRVAGGAELLRSLELDPGSTLWLMHPVSIRLYEVMLAAFHGGLRVMLADPRGGADFLRHVCETARPAAYAGPPLAQVLRWKTPAMRAIGKPVLTRGWLPSMVRWNLHAADTLPLDVNDDEPALITFTSGSTGMPKGAVRTHGLLVAQYRALVEPLLLDDGGVDLVTLPVFVLANLAAGLTSVLADTDLAQPGRPRAAAIAAQCDRLGVTRSTASPAFFEGLMSAEVAMPRFRRIFTGGGPVFPDLVRRLAATLTNTEIHAVYGSTEAEPISHAAIHQADGRCGVTAAGGGLAAGLPAPGTEVRVIRQAWGEPLGPMDGADFDAITLPPGVAGEIVVAGPQVLPGYLDGAGDSETKIRVGGRIFHRTGDAGWRDAEGCLWLLGRCSGRLPAPCQPVSLAFGLPEDAACYPFAVECALRERFPTVRTAALEWMGGRLLVIGENGSDPATIDAVHHAAAAWRIDEVAVLPSIPLDHRHQAKINYPALREMLARVTTRKSPAER